MSRIGRMLRSLRVAASHGRFAIRLVRCAPCAACSSPVLRDSSARTSSGAGWSATLARRVVAYDLLTYAGNRSNLSGRRRTGSRSWRGTSSAPSSPAEVLRDEQIEDVVVNFARRVPQQPGDARPRAVLPRRTCSAPRPCSRRARQVGVARFHHISTCEVYGDLPSTRRVVHRGARRTGPAPRTTPSKAGGTTPSGPIRDLRAARDDLELRNNYGPYQFPEKVIPLFATLRLDDQPLPLTRRANRREWLHVDDHCRAIEAVLHRGRVGETYNIGSRRGSVDRGDRGRRSRADGQARA